MSDPEEYPPCRLCGGATRLHFKARVLEKYPCAYFLCQACQSLQTEAPHWIDEAYAESSISASDAGVFLRSINNLCVIWATARVLRSPRRASVLDFGGGSGLLCRMLRDCGFDALVSDRYARNEIARGFDDRGATPDIMCAFEVAEHFPDPSEGMAQILGRNAAICVVGTEIYRGQGAGWWYIAPHHGQHLFFYSHAGMQILANRHGYLYERVGSFHFFLKQNPKAWQSGLLWRALRPSWLKWVRAYLALRLSNEYAEQDMHNATRHSQ
jgi:hypothetical protein